MEYQQILVTKRDLVATVTLNRPDKLNAWTAVMENEVSQAIRAAAADDEVRVIVLAGAGRGFCAGADISLLSDIAGGEKSGAAQGAEVPVDALVPPEFARRHAWLLAVPKPIVAAIRGPAVGLGFVIPMFCDLRLASDTARFCTIFARRGLVAEYGLAWILPRLIGLPNAADLLFTSRTIDAAEALRMGLVQRVIPDGEFDAAVHQFAADMASTVSPRSLRLMKEQLHAAPTQTLAESVDHAFRLMVESFDTEDFREGVAHYVEKRPARFTGR